MSVHDDQVRLVGPRRLDLTSGLAALVVYRWFLSSRLKKVLHALMELPIRPWSSFGQAHPTVYPASQVGADCSSRYGSFHAAHLYVTSTLV